MKRETLILVTFIALPSLGIGSCIIHDQVLETQFAGIQIGMTQQDVADVMGRPGVVLRQGETGGIHGPTSCLKEYVYSSAWAPLLPWYPTVCFGTDDRVVSKYQFFSS